ncbi:MAG: HAD family phosphatase [Firmicutes bacterium]|nr:HAD family phosphatase [Bacillota bacterium]
MIRLVAVDLDDTLINSNLEITAENLAAVDRVRRKGVQVTIATGRMHVSALPFARQLKLPQNEIIISYNGAVLRRFNGELMAHIALQRQIALDVIRYCQVRKWTLNIYHDDRLYVAELDDNVEYYMNMVGVQAHPVGDLYNFVVDQDLQLSKMLIIGSEEQMESNLPVVQAEFGEKAQVTRSKKRYIEITHFDASKGKALARLAASMGLDAQQVMAIGDSGNDLEMIKWAGLGVAVANASADVKEAADFITKSNDESGVAVALNQLI